jgi:hypothetical protein
MKGKCARTSKSREQREAEEMGESATLKEERECVANASTNDGSAS